MTARRDTPRNYRQVGSSAVDAIAYDPDRRELDIWYKGGERYGYAGVPPEVDRQLRAAASIGAFVNERIKPFYPATQKSGRRRPDA
jgi:hypothetical protein